VPATFLILLRAIEGDSSIFLSFGLYFAVVAVVQALQDTVVTPRVMGHATGLRPIAILLGVFIWGKLLGFLGLILAIPLTCLGIAYYRRYILHKPPYPALTSQAHGQ
jgi:predicted PurR-regulated permease PerM